MKGGSFMNFAKKQIQNMVCQFGIGHPTFGGDMVRPLPRARLQALT